MPRQASCTCDKCPKCQHKIYMREWYRKGKKSYDDPAKRRHRENDKWRNDPVYRKRHLARILLSQQVRRGIQVPSPCALCGETEVVGHHNDYDRPLVGTWLCAKCHATIHGPLPVWVSS